MRDHATLKMPAYVNFLNGMIEQVRDASGADDWAVEVVKMPIRVLLDDDDVVSYSSMFHFTLSPPPPTRAPPRVNDCWARFRLPCSPPRRRSSMTRRVGEETRRECGQAYCSAPYSAWRPVRDVCCEGARGGGPLMG